MPALPADILMAGVAIGELFVVVPAEETRERVTNPSNRSIFSEVLSPATAAPPFPIRLLEDVIVDVMAPEETRQLSQLSLHMSSLA